MEYTPTKRTFRNYLIFWIGQLFSLLGSSVVNFVVIWWINIETGSPIFLSIAAFFSTIPMVLIMPIVGVFIDRWNRKLTIAIADSLQALITLWLILLFTLNQAKIWPVILINGLRGVCQAFHFPTVNAIIPIMIPKDKLSRMNGINYLFTGLISAFGPQIGANLLAFFSISEIMWIDIITFFMAIIPLILIKVPTISKIGDSTEKRSYLSELRYGIKILRLVPGLLVLFIFISAINFLNMPFNTLMPFYVKYIHFGNEISYAFVTTLAQIGIVIGASLTSIKKHWNKKELVILRGILFGFIGYFMTTISPIGNFLIIGVGNLIHASMVPIINTMFLTIIQTRVPKETQGRVFSIVASIAFGITPIGMILSGPLAEILGTYLLFYSSLVIQLISTMIVWFFSNVRFLTDKQESIEIIEGI